MTTEQRTFLAVILMAAVLILYQYFFIPHEPTPAGNASSTATSPSQAPARPVPSPAPTAPATPMLPAPAAAAASRPPQRLARVGSPLYEAAVSSEGGKLQELTLKYRGEKPLIIIGELGPSGLVLASGNASAQVVPMDLAADHTTLSRERPSQDVVMSGVAEGLRVRQTLTFRADDYTIDARVRVENPSSTARTVTVALPWSTRQEWRETKERFQGQHPTELVWSSHGQVAREDGLCAVTPVATDGEWIAMDSVWYMAALIPHEGGFTLVAGGESKACEPKGKDPVGRATIAVQARPTIAPGQAWEGRVTIFAGPKEYDRLKAHGLDGAINFGGFPFPRRYGGLPMEWLGVPILLLLNWVYRHVGNYGVAIILLTVVSKVLFYPLTVKSMRSMKAMQALQPQINSLRNKYKSDPQRLQSETMALYREHKVNPMGGCLPMIAQIPIFYALYLALSVSVDLQNAEFLCFGSLFGVNFWICDLASHDPTYVLPILMGITMFLQQKMTPTAADPRQAKMMLVMPFVFTFMFLNLPSGLVLYWTVSNVLQILQQWYMDRPRRRAAA
ncbi:MAG TPA: membrane protein insertase YidC [Methylomirabilota bacterium]